MRILSAFYDLKVSPVTFDIFEFLYQAEIERLNSRMDALDLIIVANDTNCGFPEEIVDSNSIGEQRWRLRNLLLPASSLLTSARRSVYCPTRDEAEWHIKNAEAVFPHGYSLQYPIASYLPSETLVAMYQGKKLGTFQAPVAARSAAQDWLQNHSDGRKPITITLREATAHISRNSNFKEWQKFIDWLDKDKYFAVLIPDTASLFKQATDYFKDVIKFELGALDLQLRLAIYEIAYLNMMLSSGPGTLCFLDNSTRAIRFKMLTPGDETSNYASSGFQWGMQCPNSSTFQKSVWEEDSFETLVREFEEMVAVIERSVTTSPRPLPDIYQTISLFLAGENTNSAETLLCQLLKDDPNDFQAMLLLAKARHIQQDYSNAAETFEKVDSMARNNAEVNAGWGKSLLRNNQFPEAIAKLKRAIEIGTSDPYVAVDLADAYMSISEYQDALALLRGSFATLEGNDVTNIGWEVGKRLVYALLKAGGAQEARDVAVQLRDRYGHYSEIAKEIETFVDSIEAQIGLK